VITTLSFFFKQDAPHVVRAAVAEDNIILLRPKSIQHAAGSVRVCAVRTQHAIHAGTGRAEGQMLCSTATSHSVMLMKLTCGSQARYSCSQVPACVPPKSGSMDTQWRNKASGKMAQARVQVKVDGVGLPCENDGLDFV
jgi:hypothetical protein